MPPSQATLDLAERFVTAVERIADALDRQATTGEQAMAAAMPVMERTTRSLDRLDEDR